MKRVTFLTVLLIACLILSSCHSSQTQTDVYDVLINEEVRGLSHIDADNYGKFTMSGRQYVNDVEEEKVVQILDESYSLTYLHSISSNISGENLDYYSNDQLDCQIAYSTETGDLMRIVSKTTNGVIINAGVSVLITETYFPWLNDVIKDTLGIDVNNYTLNCATYYVDGTSDKTFVPSSTSKEKQVDFYYFEYAKYIGNYKSSEIVKVISQPDGSLKSLIHLEFPNYNFEELSISEDKLNQTIEKTVYDICASKYTAKNYTVKSMLWQVYEGTPYLMCGIEIISVDRAGEEIGSSVIFAISP